MVEAWNLVQSLISVALKANLKCVFKASLVSPSCPSQCDITKLLLILFRTVFGRNLSLFSFGFQEEKNTNGEWRFQTKLELCKELNGIPGFLTLWMPSPLMLLNLYTELSVPPAYQPLHVVAGRLAARVWNHGPLRPVVVAAQRQRVKTN